MRKYKTLSGAVSALIKLRATKAAARKAADEVEKEVREMEEQIQTMMQKARVNKASLHGLALARSPKVVAQVEDWDAVYRYIADNHHFGLLYRRLNMSALEQLRELQGETPPGLSLQEIEVLKVTKQR